MKLNIQFEFLFVGKNEEGFVKNYFYELDDTPENVSQKAGKIFMTLEVMNNLALGEDIGGLIFSTLKSNFYKNLDEDPYVRFEEALKFINRTIIEAQEERELKFLSNIHIVVAAIVRDELFLSQAGDAEAYLIRRKHVSVLTEGLSSDNVSQSDFFLNIASGTLEKGDTVVLSSASLLRFISKSEFGNAFAEPHLASALTQLKQFLSREVHNKTAVFALRVQETRANVSVISESQQGSEVPRFSFQGDMVRQAFFSLKERVFKMPSFWARIRSFKRERFLALIAVSVVLLVVATIGIKMRNNEQARIASFNGILEEVQLLITSAETKGNFDKKTASMQLEEAKTKALEVYNSGFHYNKARQFLDDIDRLYNDLDSVVRMKEGENYRVVADLSQKRSNIDVLGIIPAKDAFYVYEYNALYRVVLNSVDDPLTIDETEIVTQGTYFDEQDSLVFLTKSNRIIEYQDGQFSFMDNEDGNWHGGVDLKAYSNKLYILSPEENQIWRYVRRRDNYSRAEPYNVDADVKDSSSFAIDGNIYVLKTSGDILKLYTGNKQDFRVSKGPLNPPTSPTKIYTELDINQIYVLEPSRILVYIKDTQTADLVYSRQYVFENLENLRDFYVDKTSNTLYLVDKSKVYAVNL